MHTIQINGPIGREPGEFSARELREQLARAHGPVTIVLDSEGGSVFEGFAIYDAIKNHPAPTKAIVINAFSMASVVALACDEVEITENGYIMMHDPHIGDGEELTEGELQLLDNLGNRLAKIYAEQSGMEEEEVVALMGEETFLDAESAIEHGFVDRVVGKVQGRSFAMARASFEAKRSKDAAAKWNGLIQGKVAAGIPRPTAIRQLEDENPGLRQRMIAEVNAVSRKPEHAPRAGKAQAKFKGLVDAKVALGLTRTQALRNVVVENPELHQQYLREYNASLQAR